MEIDQGTGDWKSVFGVTTYHSDPSAFITEGIVAGTEYQIRIRALNIYGWGQFSQEPYFTIVASGIPQVMDPVQIEYSQATVVKVSWTSPYSNSEMIQAYEILFRTSAGEFKASDLCDGSLSTVVASLECFLPLTTLRSSPFNLEFDSLIVAKARAYNQFGWAEFNQQNVEGARIQTEPGKVQRVELILETSTLRSLELEWPAVVQDGNSPIDSYNLQVLESGLWSDLKGHEGQEDLATSATADNLSPDTLYTFRVRARNAHGWSVWSDEHTFRTSTRPDTPAPAATTLMNPNVRVSWNAPTDNFEQIYAYEVLVRGSDGVWRA